MEVLLNKLFDKHSEGYGVYDRENLIKDICKELQNLQLQQTGVNGSFLYSIQVLEKEKNLIKDCLSNWEKENYPEAKKEREQRLKDINNALEKLK